MDHLSHSGVPSDVHLLCKFAAFAYEINSFISVTTKHALVILLCIIIITTIIYYYHFIQSEFFTPALASDLSLESE